jgi:hypothetical protein
LSTIHSAGYILVYVGKKHHLADVRGYAYEHRLIAENKIGRRLNKGELVHHIDGNPQNNNPENLEVVISNAYHFFLHRKGGKVLRIPGEENVIVECKCGCGQKFLKYDFKNRNREYISGHNPSNKFRTNAVLREIQQGKHTAKEIAGSLNVSVTSISIILGRIAKRNLIVRIKKGFYAEAGTPQRANPLIECACGCGSKFLKHDVSWRERKYVSGHNMKVA